jgi:peptide/nickel transport system permease protein
MSSDTTTVTPGTLGQRRRRLPASLVIGAVLIGLVIGTAALSFVWTPYDPFQVRASERLLPPGSEHWFGTDRFGRDIASQLMVGARTTLFVGVIAVGIAATIGIPVGVGAAMGPRWLSTLIMRGIDLNLAFPALLLAIMLGAVYGASTLTAMVAIGIATVPRFARLARSGTLQVLASEYVLAARVAGRGQLPIALRHVLPNIASMLLVQASVSYGIAVLAESGLSFLGFGTAPPTPSWGRMVAEGRELIAVFPLLTVWPAVAIAVAVLGFNLLGDGLRDRLDPRLEVGR